jgi:putative protein-disulfide isomerase
MHLLKLVCLLCCFSLTVSCQQATPNVSAQMPTPTDTPTLYYVFDALCGWCYGFSPVMQRVAAGYAGKMNIEVISGGMVTGTRIGPIGKVAPYIKEAHKDVERATGTKFGDAFLNGTLATGTAIFSSIEPALAIATVRNANPAKALAFAHDVQHAIYFDGIAPTNLEAIAPYASKYGISESQFLNEAKSQSIMAQALKEFKMSDSLKVTGFPTLFILKNQKLIRIAEGYLPQAELEKRIDKVLDNPQVK